MITRKLIRDRIVANLIGKTDAGEKVYPSRSFHTAFEELPAILVYLKDESVIIFDESPRRYQRTANFTIECISIGDDDMDADIKVEKLLRQAEDALSIDETQGLKIDDSFLGNVQFQSDPDGQSPVMAAVMTFTVVYYTEPNPITDAPDFTTANIRYQVGHHDESSDEIIDAEETVTIPEE